VRGHGGVYGESAKDRAGEKGRGRKSSRSGIGWERARTEAASRGALHERKKKGES